MGIEERKSRERVERRSLILNKAKELVLERGVTSLTMQDIAQAAELSKATLYLYFQSKEAILIDIMDEAATAFVKFAQPRVLEATSGLEALHTLWASYLTLFGESQDVIVLTGIKNYIDPGFPLIVDERNSGIYDSSMKMVGLIADVLHRGMADGTLIKGLEPEKLARTVIMIATSIIDTVAKVPRPSRDASLIRTEMCRTFEILLRGLAAQNSDPGLLALSLESIPDIRLDAAGHRNKP